MKKLIFTISLLAAFSLTAQTLENKTMNLISTYNQDSESIVEINNIDNIDTEFDFNTKDYLPKGFDAYAGMFLAYNNWIEDAAFEFNTKNYLPLGFNANISFEGLTSFSEEDTAFNFDVKNYLPKDFNAYVGLTFDFMHALEICEI